MCGPRQADPILMTLLEAAKAPPRATALTLFCVLLLVLLTDLPKRFAIDDAYITLHNARVLLSGAPDPMYGTSYLVAATSAIYLALLALVGLIFPLPTASFIVLFGAVLLYAVGLNGSLEITASPAGDPSQSC